MALEKERITLGFIPLTDCAPLVIAKEKGWFAEQGLDVTLSKETSWSNIRDKVAIGVLDGAQMPAPMVLAASAGLGPFKKPMVTALSLDLNGNAITVSDALYRRMREIAPQQMVDHQGSAAALKQLIELERSGEHNPITLATVFPHSTHSYQLRYWAASVGLDPDRDLRLVVIPPPQMPRALEEGRIDGFCAGEPWNEVAVKSGIGRVLITGYEIWNNAPEKVLGVTEEWAEQNPETHQALIEAILQAARWMDMAENRDEVVEIIARGIYVNAPADVVRMSMTGTFQYSADEAARNLPDFNVFHRYAANFPWRSHAVWILSQMARWGELVQPLDFHRLAESVYRCDVYRAAARSLNIAAPLDDYKSEGSHAEAWQIPADQGELTMGRDRFVDGQLFDPADPLGYLRGQGVIFDHAAHDRVVPIRNKHV